MLQANAEMDAGDIWASVEFAMPGGSKSSVYRTEVADAAAGGGAAGRDPVRHRPVPARAAGLRPNGRHRGLPAALPPDPTGRSTGRPKPPRRYCPGCAPPTPAPASSTSIGDTEFYLYGGYPEDELRGRPGTILARRDGAICRATVDGAVWIPQLRRRPGARRPEDLQAARHARARWISWTAYPEVPAPLTLPPGRRTYRQISYRESGEVGYLEFSFPGGAMSTGQCRRLLAAYRHAQARPVR